MTTNIRSPDGPTHYIAASPKCSSYQYNNANLQLQIYDPDMVEIKTMKVTLPGTNDRIQFPEIILKIDLKDTSSWQVAAYQVLFTIYLGVKHSFWYHQSINV